MTGGAASQPAVAALVLGAVLLVGVAAGRAKRRWSLLLAGLVALVVLGAVATMLLGSGGGDRAAQVTAVYTVALPLVVAFAAGWLCGRGTWFRRLIVLAAAALLLVVFPYDVAGRATADTLPGIAAPAARPPD